ncbi:uncharacterized protein VP01_3502g2 [Puccinia sorghi]|uniref:Uncharacterized protein n=1 Tax=Puccinia sorghi TaxID=27349 RepID=A0A0L6UVS9_9BASI|nr:uncharacterized protein VP01_3502g2 [Puccinia sorghi]
MKDYTAIWFQPYQTKVFNGEEVVFSKFINDFKSSFFDHANTVLKLPCDLSVKLELFQPTPRISIQTLVHFADAPLMSLYQHGLKENVQLTVVMRNLQFTSLWDMQAMGLKAGQTIEGIQNRWPAPNPSASTSSPATNPNAMDLLEFQKKPSNQLSLQKKTCSTAFS